MHSGSLEWQTSSLLLLKTNKQYVDAHVVIKILMRFDESLFLPFSRFHLELCLRYLALCLGLSASKANVLAES